LSARPIVALVALSVFCAACAPDANAGSAETAESGAAVTSPGPSASTSSQPASPFAELYDRGLDFGDFLAAADQRRETWHNNYARSALDPETIDRVRALSGAWRLLVVAEDWCGDSANTIPYLARLVEAADGLNMKVIDSEVGRRLMEAYPTPDGRPATPTVLVLDEAGREVGCWLERPATLQDWFLSNEDRLADEDLFDRKYAWYDWDVGEHTVSDLVDVLEGAAAGEVVCPSRPRA